jgi:glycosyltransferase involved in cell wall biosynthesis
MTSPIVSVVLPVFNCEKYIEKAIVSVLEQSFSDFELIIINDGSTDSSEDKILSFTDIRIRYIKQTNKGLSATLNYGISISSGEYIARMDADDICMPSRLESQLTFFGRDSTVGIVSSNVEYIDESGRKLGLSLSFTKDKLIKKAMKKGNVIFHPTVMFKKNIFESVNGYDEVIGCYFEDYLLWLEMLKETHIAVVRKPLLQYRLLSNSLSRSKPIGIAGVERKVANAGGYYDGLYVDFKNSLNSEKATQNKNIKSVNNFFHIPLSILKNITGLFK